MNRDRHCTFVHFLTPPISFPSLSSMTSILNSTTPGLGQTSTRILRILPRSLRSQDLSSFGFPSASGLPNQFQEAACTCFPNGALFGCPSLVLFIVLKVECCWPKQKTALFFCLHVFEWHKHILKKSPEDPRRSWWLLIFKWFWELIFKQKQVQPWCNVLLFDWFEIPVEHSARCPHRRIQNWSRLSAFLPPLAAAGPNNVTGVGGRTRVKVLQIGQTARRVTIKPSRPTLPCKISPILYTFCWIRVSCSICSMLREFLWKRK